MITEAFEIVLYLVEVKFENKIKQLTPVMFLHICSSNLDTNTDRI